MGAIYFSHKSRGVPNFSTIFAGEASIFLVKFVAFVRFMAYNMRFTDMSELWGGGCKID